MKDAATLGKNIVFWHWFPEMLLEGLTSDQLRWQPDTHDTSVQFATWHAYRAEDELLHGMVFGRPSVYTSEHWADRLPAGQTGATPFGNGLTREGIAALAFEPHHLLAYAKAVGESVVGWLEAASEAELRAEVKLPFFTGVYPGVDVMTKLDTIAFFSIGHVSEHLGEVQFLRGLMGLRGAPL
jgi:hypothetical protein